MLDLYCERLGPGLWAEPLNAVSNVAFLVAAWAGWDLARRRRALSGGVWLLIGLTVAIGVGSGLFHTFATPWARVLDVLPILLFQLAYLWVYGRVLIELRVGSAVGLLAGFLAAVLAGRLFPHVLNGSLSYAPAVLIVLGLGPYHYGTRGHARFAALAAGGVFVLALVFRTIDSAVCPSFPLGTHFLWHLLVPVALYLFMRGLVLNLDRG